MDQKRNERESLNGRDTVLFVVGAKSDLPEQIRSSLTWPIEVAMSCTEALELAPWDRIGLAVVMHDVPDGPGAKCLRRIASRYPQVRRVIAVTVEEQGRAHAALEEGVAERYLRVPFDLERVEAVVRAAFEHTESASTASRGTANNGGTDVCERRLCEAVLAAVPQTVMLVDEKRIVRSVNKLPPHMPWLVDEIVGLSVTETLAKGLAQPDQFGEAIDVVFSEHRPVSLDEIIHRTEGGLERVWKVELFPVDLPGVPSMVLLNICDETERRRLWLSLVEAEKMAGVGMLAGGVAHEFNNLIGGLLGFAQLAEMSGDFEDYKHLAEAVFENGERAQKITSDLQALACNGASESSTGTVEESIAQVIALTEKRGRKSGVRVEIKVQPALMLHTDFRSLQQVLLQLLLSAMAGMPSGGLVTISAMVAEDGRFTLEILDDGLPFDEDVLKNVFMPFPTIKRRTLDGVSRVSGLGLAVSQAVVEGLGGTIIAENREDVGARVVVCLPASTVVS